jgi:hypothetical protein
LTGINFQNPAGADRSLTLSAGNQLKIDGHHVRIEPRSRNVNMTGQPHIRRTRPRQFGPRS